MKGPAMEPVLRLRLTYTTLTNDFLARKPRNDIETLDGTVSLLRGLNISKLLPTTSFCEVSDPFRDTLQYNKVPLSPTNPESPRALQIRPRTRKNQKICCTRALPIFPFSGLQLKLSSHTRRSNAFFAIVFLCFDSQFFKKEMDGGPQGDDPLMQ